jgi:hypothetical protein
MISTFIFLRCLRVDIEAVSSHFIDITILVWRRYRLLQRQASAVHVNIPCLKRPLAGIDRDVLCPVTISAWSRHTGIGHNIRRVEDLIEVFAACAEAEGFALLLEEAAVAWGLPFYRLRSDSFKD